MADPLAAARVHLRGWHVRWNRDFQRDWAELESSRDRIQYSGFKPIDEEVTNPTGPIIGKQPV